MSTRIKVAQNAAILMVTQIITWVMALLLTIFLPRYLGPTAVGQYHFSNSIWAVLSIVASLGMDTYITKEAARRPDQVASMVWNSAILRFFFFLVAVAGLYLYLNAFHYPVETQQVALVIGVSSLGWMLISITQDILIGFENMKFVSLGNIIGRVVGTSLSIALLLAGYKVVVIAAVNSIAALVTLTVEFIALKRIIPIPFKAELTGMKQLVKGGVPYLLSGIFLVLYLQFDFILISLLVDEKTVGYYGMANQLFGTMLFIPTVLMTAVFPVLSRMFINDPDGLPRVTRKSFDMLVLLGIPIGLGVIAAAPSTVSVLFGPQFGPSAPILSLFGIVIILTYINVFIGQFLISVDRQNQWTAVMAVATAATLPLDLWLIPLCNHAFGNGGIGGSISFIVTEAGMLIAGLFLMPKGILGRSNIWYAARVLFSGVLMLAAIWWIRSVPVQDIFRLFLIVITGAVIFLLLGLVTRILTNEDLQLAKLFLDKLTGKLGGKKVLDEAEIG